MQQQELDLIINAVEQAVDDKIKHLVSQLNTKIDVLDTTHSKLMDLNFELVQNIDRLQKQTLELYSSTENLTQNMKNQSNDEILKKIAELSNNQNEMIDMINQEKLETEKIIKEYKR